MKTLNVIAIVLSLLLIILTSQPYSQPDAARPAGHNSGYWVNPDGSRGLAAGSDNESASQRRVYSWANPDGARGTDQNQPGQSLASGSSWVNPDGTAGRMSPAQARADGPDSTF